MQIIQESIIKGQLSEMWGKLRRPMRDVKATILTITKKYYHTPETKEIKLGNYAFGIQGGLKPLISSQK